MPDVKQFAAAVQRMNLVHQHQEALQHQFELARESITSSEASSSSMSDLYKEQSEEVKVSRIHQWNL